MHEEYKTKKENLKEVTKESILEKYGGEQYLERAPKEIMDGQTENYVEYSRTGQVIKGKERAKARSKYPEDGRSYRLNGPAQPDTNLPPSLRQQPYFGVGLVVRRYEWRLGLWMLPLECTHVVLRWRGW